ncbi:hypothetical protein ANN_11024 [Periplaneta americana]|uniref:Reverse transcriptase domain-containing protein n=1 Tax=Periplaneta americana TaxID=6978 RepID=A0ABQ8T4J8_PERAM|nr:hypothetical protein ANN_11024 [Periplaneta americana]
MARVIIGGRRIKCIRFADDMALLAGEETILKDMLLELNDSSEQYGMKINANKTKHGYRKKSKEDIVYVPPLPATMVELKDRITDAFRTITRDMPLYVWDELQYRIDMCRVTRGGHIEHLWQPWRERDSRDIVARSASCAFRLLLTSANPTLSLTGVKLQLRLHLKDAHRHIVCAVLHFRFVTCSRISSFQPKSGYKRAHKDRPSCLQKTTDFVDNRASNVHNCWK